MEISKRQVLFVIFNAYYLYVAKALFFFAVIADNELGLRAIVDILRF